MNYRFFLRLNPFICLFDPVLHTVEYVRSTSPFLFTCLIMAGCKFWKPHLYPACQQLAHENCVKCFQHGVKNVGVVQAFACMTYWKEPDDNVRALSSLRLYALVIAFAPFVTLSHSRSFTMLTSAFHCVHLPSLLSYHTTTTCRKPTNSTKSIGHNNRTYGCISGMGAEWPSSSA